ncbi:hypothetical protein ACIO93_36055 [Streptomyces sp. NPDC087903]|uniref:hypothetical protein n=1 Tax=Streptomyces sp. NPDC087903 TaxID=3365819 RepID=UPI003822BA71
MPPARPVPALRLGRVVRVFWSAPRGFGTTSVVSWSPATPVPVAAGSRPGRPISSRLTTESVERIMALAADGADQDDARLLGVD